MVLEGIEAVRKYREKVKDENLAEWYDRHIGINERPRGMRRDAYINMMVRNSQIRRAAELEQEIEERDRMQRLSELHSQMYEAMGPDYDPDGFAMFP